MNSQKNSDPKAMKKKTRKIRRKRKEKKTFIALGLFSELGHVNLSLSFLLGRHCCKKERQTHKTPESLLQRWIGKQRETERKQESCGRKKCCLYINMFREGERERRRKFKRSKASWEEGRSDLDRQLGKRVFKLNRYIRI